MKIIQIENKSGKVRLNDVVMRDVVEDLLSEIGSVFGAQAAMSGENFGKMMNCAENAADTLDIEIHTPGGSVLEGYKVYNAILDLRSRGVYVTATINTLAASMGSVIAMAADKIRMVKGGRMMIHEVSSAVQGDAAEMRKQADLLENMSNEIAGIYAERTGKDVKEMRGLMLKETWMSAEQALAGGFIDEFVDIRPVKAKPTDMKNIFANLFPGNEAAARLDSEIAENATIRSELEAANLKITELSGLAQEIATKNQEISNLTTERDTFKAADAAKATEIANLTKALEDEKASVPGKITEALAQAGIEKPLDEEGNKPATNHIETLNKLTGVEQTAYFNEHREAIRAEYNSQR